jgi:hypothetical protein
VSNNQNRRLTADEREALGSLLREIRSRLDSMAGANAELRFALNRRLYRLLSYDERGTPAFRKKLKEKKLAEQGGNCPLCSEPLELRDSELDRISASVGYTAANTRLVHHACHRKDQQRKGFSDTSAGVIFVEEADEGPGAWLNAKPAISDEAAVPELPEDVAKDYDGSPM